MKETIVIIGKEVYKKLPAKEKKEFYHFERYKRMYERETGKDGDWVGDDAFDNLDDLCKFSGVEDADDIDFWTYIPVVIRFSMMKKIWNILRILQRG